ncbi:MAG: glycosyl transferase family 6 [Lachnospiraceae bacterium]|nr:glycosyl transferase family 6 [Lachnospiraceae bacterium]
MRVAILYIATGKYTVFWKEFYESFEKNFLPKTEKSYFVFTDDKKLIYADRTNVCVIPQKNLGWPDNTLQRFSLFTREEERFKDYDYTFFINANFLCIKTVTEEEFLPVEQDLLVAEHASAHGKNPNDMTYDRNPKSLAYVPFGEGQYYVMGGLNGGKTKNYLDMVHKLKSNVDIDTANGVVAAWHDESHLNRFIIGRTDVKILPPCYGCPEGWDLPYEATMFIRDKSRYFDVEAVKAGSLSKRIKLYFGRIKSKIAIRKRISKLISFFRKGD